MWNLFSKIFGKQIYTCTVSVNHHTEEQNLVYQFKLILLQFDRYELYSKEEVWLKCTMCASSWAMMEATRSLFPLEDTWLS